MAIYRNKETGDLVDAWMHSKAEDDFQVAFPNWLHVIWEKGTAFTKKDGSDWLKTAEGVVEIPDGFHIVRQAGGVLSVVSPEKIRIDYAPEG